VARVQRLAGNRTAQRLVAGTAPVAGRTVAAPAPVVQRDYERGGSQGGVYESERFGGDGSKRERVTYVELPVRATGTKDRGAAPPPLSQFAHGGKTDVVGTERKAGFDGGHVVGLQIGGEDITENVVPMFKAFNRGAYKKMEDEVRKRALELQTSGLRAWVTIHCYYDEDTVDTPYAFDIVLESTPASSDERTAVWRQFLRQPEDIKLVEPLSGPDQQIVRGEVGAPEVHAAAGLQLEESANFFVLGDSKSVAAYIDKHKHLPQTTNGMYPDSVTLRPYEYLDLLYYAGKLDAGTSLGAHREFTGRQRELILQANLARNGGTLRSDDPADTVNGGVLNEMGDLNFPEIDHIVPKSRGGSNMFSNARVVSWQLNNKDDRVKSLFGVIDMTKRELPPLAGMGAKDMPVLVENYIYRAQPPGPFTEHDVWAWGTQNFTVMGGVQTTAARLGRVKAALLTFVTNGLLTQGAGQFSIKR
jgi:hypothetical protein